MELRQLEYFAAVADEASFTKAANRLHVAQPGVSAQVRQLERELGQELLDRSGKRVRLTEAGSAVLRYARAALDAASGARLVVDELAGLARGRVSVGMVVACTSLELTDLLADFHLQHPAVEIALTEANSDRLVDGLREGTLDLAFVALGSTMPDGIEARIVVDEAVVAVVAHSHPLAVLRSLPLLALRDEPLVGMPPGTGLRACLDDACRTAGFEPRVAVEASNLGMVARLAARGLGVAVVPESVAAVHAADLQTLPLAGAVIRGRLALAWRNGTVLRPAARALIAAASTMEIAAV